jgi:hypothetical protein
MQDVRIFLTINMPTVRTVKVVFSEEIKAS